MRKCGACSYCKDVRTGLSIKIRDKSCILNGRCNCETKGVVYVAFCDSCPSFYIGKTEIKLKQRIYEHQYSILKGDMNNALAKHVMVHPEHKFTFSVLQQIPLDPRGGPWQRILEEQETSWQIRTLAYFPQV